MSVSDQLREQRLTARRALQRAGRLAFKPVSSAKWVDIQQERDGSIRVIIEHDDIKGVTPAMLRWWFENLAGSTMWNGVDFTGPEVKFYHLWHHRDHIGITPLSDVGVVKNKGFQVGALSLIDECFNDFRRRIHSTTLTTRLDEEEFNFSIMAGGQKFGHIFHRYAPVDGGCSFYAETRIGSELPLLGPILNWLLVPRLFPRLAGEQWILHNIEETGRTEDILPTLYRHHVGEVGSRV